MAGSSIVGSPAFQGVSMLAGLMVSLGSTNLVGQMINGLVLVYTRTLRPGDFVEIADCEGTVEHVGLFSCRLRTPNEEVVTLPNSTVAAGVRNFSRAAEGSAVRFVTAVTIGSDTPWQRVHELLLTQVPASLSAELNLIYGRTPEQVLKLDFYRPKAGGDRLPACVLVHGGGWTGGDEERFTHLAIALAERGYAVANIEYPLAGVAKYPVSVQDCSLAVRFVRANAARFGVDPARIGAWGGSAGGHLVGLLAGADRHPRFLTDELREVSAAVQATCIMAGPTDLTGAAFVQNLRQSGEKSNGFQWLGRRYDDAPALYREASPLTHFTRSTGPVFFLTGDLDNPERDGAGLEKLKSLGVATRQVILKDARPGCWMQRPWFEQCVNAVDDWFREHLRK